MQTDVPQAGLFEPRLRGAAARWASGSGEPAVISDFQPAQRVLRCRHRPIGRALLGAASAACIGWALVGGVGATSTPTAAVTVVVRPGDTLWSIADGHSGGGDVRDEVAQILSANHLNSPIIQVGETLVIPSD
jgi:nucleoid-associated protein YgaU